MKSPMPQTLQMPLSLAAWGTATFNDTVKRELAAIDHELLPLQQLLRYGSNVADRPSFMILGCSTDGEVIHIRAGVFFRSVQAGCSCSDDPTPMDTHEEYGELEVQVDRATGVARMRPSE